MNTQKKEFQKIDIGESWIIKTKQGWKVAVFFVLLFSGFATLILMILVINKVIQFSSFDDFELALAPVGFGIAAFIWFCKSVRCPYCGYKPVWPILRKESADEWLREIVLLQHCPSCQDKGG